MFKFSRKSPTNPSGISFNTLIGPNTVIEGAIYSEGALRVDGHINGDITFPVEDKSIIAVGASGDVIGNIISGTVIVQGSVKGNIEAERVHIYPTGQVLGDITYYDLIVDAGSEVVGRLIKLNPNTEKDSKEGDTI